MTMTWLQQQLLLCLIIFGITKKTFLTVYAREVTGETKDNYDSCWNRGFKDWLSSAGDCQLWCTLDNTCNTWAYHHDRFNKRCHFCSWKEPRVEKTCNDVKPCSTWGWRDDNNSPIEILKSALSLSRKICLGEVQADDAALIASDLNSILNMYKDGNLDSNEAFNEYLPTAGLMMTTILETENRRCFNDYTGPQHTCKYASLVLFQMRVFLLYMDGNSERAFPKKRDKQRKELFDKHKILMADNGWFNTKTLQSIESFYSQLPDHIKTEGVLHNAPLFARQSVKDAWKCNGEEKNLYIEVSNRGFNVFKLQEGSHFEQGFPFDTPDRVPSADLQLVVTRHEVAHQFDRIIVNRANNDGDSRLKDLKLMLTKASEGSNNNWLRSNVDDAYFQSAPQEIIASQIGNQYFQSTTAQLRLAAHRLTATDGWIRPSYPEVEEEGKAKLTKKKFECRKQDKNLGTFSTAQQCVDTAFNNNDCSGYEVMYSPRAPSWGCRCCTAIDKLSCPTTEDLYKPHNLWNVYQYKNTKNPASCESTGIPMSWFLFNVDLMSTPDTNKAPFYEDEVDGYVRVTEVSISRDGDDRIATLDIPSCGEITFTYDSDGIVDSVTSNAITCKLPCADDPKWNVMFYQRPPEIWWWGTPGISKMRCEGVNENPSARCKLIGEDGRSGYEACPEACNRCIA